MNLDFKPNLGSTDQAIRVGIALGLLAAVYFGWLVGGWAYAGVALAGSQLLEATLGY